MTDPTTIYASFVKEETDATQRRNRKDGPLAVVQEWQRRLASGARGVDEVVDVEKYTENCLGLTGWTTGFGIAAQNFFKNMMQPFADLTSTIEEVVEGETAATIRMRQSAKHVGEFLGIAPTGRRVSWDFVAIVHVREGKVVGQWAQMDLYGVYLELTGSR